ncbi:MAG: winged helix-turn-helix domain-containing protein [Anaerolineae bacterium]|nr:winged helix-turn-helix domain-containing protein [Anaerolineae bacterium]
MLLQMKVIPLAMTMQPDSTLTPARSHDVIAILDDLATGQAVAVIGLSNFGKSTLLRQFALPAVAAEYRVRTQRPVLFVYVDCNRMLQMSAQGFYEAILRALLETLTETGNCGPLCDQIDEFYRKVVESRSDFAIPLAFNDAVIALLDSDAQRPGVVPRDVLLLLDEFDDVLTGLDERVFLNLRALFDKYGTRLNYVTATLKPLATEPGGDNLAEFVELFAANRYHLKPLNDDDATAVAAEIFEQNNDSLDPHEREYILERAGGHPGLIHAVAHVVMQVESGAPATYTQQALSVADDVLQNHPLVRTELGKLWKQLLTNEQDAAILTASRGPAALTTVQRTTLLTRGILIQAKTQLRLFSRLFAHYARRQGLIHQELPDGVWVDTDAGTVWVNGQIVEALTDLEYRLLLLLYGRVGKICDKYQIVESVWGQEYLGEVDDARIEKLISRLRAKLEPTPSRPRFVVTVRGRGYKLNNPQGMPDRPNGNE